MCGPEVSEYSPKYGGTLVKYDLKQGQNWQRSESDQGSYPKRMIVRHRVTEGDDGELQAPTKDLTRC